MSVPTSGCQVTYRWHRTRTFPFQHSHKNGSVHFKQLLE